MKVIVSLLIAIVFLTGFSFPRAQDEIKRYQKIENRLYRKELKLKEHFEKIRALTHKKYAQRLTRLERKKSKLPSVKYDRKKKRIDNWYEKKLEKIQYQEANVFEKLERQRQHLAS